MGVIRFEKEAPAAVAPSRMFKAFVDSHNLLPKIAPQAFKSIDILQGDGGVGTIKLWNFADGKSCFCLLIFQVQDSPLYHDSN